MAFEQVLRYLIREPAEVYHAKSKDHLTAHALNEFRRCPLLYRKKELGLVPERDTTAYLIGRAAHALIWRAASASSESTRSAGRSIRRPASRSARTRRPSRNGLSGRASRSSAIRTPHWSSR